MPKRSFIIGADRSLLLDDKEHGTQHVENVGGREKLEPVGRVKSTQAILLRHWRRFWCCYLLGMVIFLAISLPIFFLVIIPAIAQRLVDDTDLPVYSAEILDPKPDEVNFVLHTSINIPLSLRVRTDPLSLNLFNRDVKPMKEYLTVDMPAYSLKGKTNLDITKNGTKILDQEEFMHTLEKAVYNERFTMSAKGSTNGHLGALKVPLTFDKDIELDGLDKLRGFAIDSARLVVPKEEDGTNLRGTAILPNHSVFTFALGNVTLDLRSTNILIGQATIENVLLKPGNNSVALRGHLDVNIVLDHLPAILAAQSAAIMEGQLELSASGNSTVYNGDHIMYYEKVLQGLTLTARAPIAMVLLNTLSGLMDSTDSGWSGLNISNFLDKLDLTNNTQAELAVRSLKGFMGG
ncbi:unnamed protein product [Penicillium nalgiovense]|nr:unnamed protein product [Penicillium nalgiovense]CAG8285564.1 unnamed protein product [Penicillium nalgiovense]CAG8315456.1 unnamed protein product [Penicillium nalgiovense]CAG8347494.1 unnamed protein product [Penicillium nalgiovense]